MYRVEQVPGSKTLYKPTNMKPKYRVGKKNKVAILVVETGEEYLIFPHAKKERVYEYCKWLNDTNYLRLTLDRLSLICGIMLGAFGMVLFLLICKIMTS